MKISAASVEAVIADGEPGQQVGRDVVDIDQPQRQTAKQVEPQLSLTARERKSRCRDRRRQGGRNPIGPCPGGASGNPVSKPRQSAVLKTSCHPIPGPRATVTKFRTHLICVSWLPSIRPAA